MRWGKQGDLPDELRQVGERIQRGWQGPSPPELDKLRRRVVVRTAQSLIAGAAIREPEPERASDGDGANAATVATPTPPAAPAPETGDVDGGNAAAAVAASRVAPERAEPEPEPRSQEPRDRSRYAVAAGAFLTIALVGGADGAYHADAWGWVVLAFVWVGALALVLRDRISFGSFDIAACAVMLVLTAWIGASIAWSDDVPQSVLELQRALVYLTGLVAALVALRQRSVRWFMSGLLAGITAVCIAGLLTRFFPSEGVGSDVISQNRLSDPFGYWNALGIFAGMGSLVALGFAAHGRRVGGRVAAAAAIPVLLATLYFTYSRGAWIALAIGAVATVAIDPRRLRLITNALLLAPASAAAVLLSADSNALTRLRASQDLIVDDGRRMALILLALVAASAATALLMSLAASRLRPGPGVRRGYGAALGLAVVVGLVVVLVRFGGPATIADDAYESFKDENPAPAAPATAKSRRNDLNSRLFTLRSNGRIDYWEASWDQNQSRPLVGAGAGSFEQYWLRERSFPSQVRDAHGLYAESLGELGWIGLVLFVLMLGVPLVAGVRARHDVLVPGAFGALAAFAAHAGVDWDWEVPAVTLVALSCGAILVVCARASSERRVVIPLAVRAALVIALVAVGAFSAVGLVGNRALARANAAADEARWRDAEREARTAKRWAPWAAAGWHDLGRAQLGLGRRRQARTTLLEAVAKDRTNWRGWYDLGNASRGREQLRAYRQAALLNPFATDVQALRDAGYRLPKAPEPTR